MIKVSNLVFDYMTKRALHGVSFEIEKGSIVALIGANGAGKTTLMRCMAGLVKPFSGSILLDDIDVSEDSRNAHKYISYLSDVFGLYDNLNAKQCLTYAALAFDTPQAEIEGRVMQTAEMLNLTDHLSSYSGNLSRGLRQRLAIAIGIIHRPKFIILDEPASGLDPEARIELSRLFTKLKNEGHTLLISSHILAELEDYATHVMVLDNGRLVTNRKLDGTGAEGKMPIIPVMVKAASNNEGVVKFLKDRPGISALSCDDGLIRFHMEGKDTELSALLKAMVSANFEIIEFMKEKSSLKRAYFETLEKGV